MVIILLKSTIHRQNHHTKKTNTTIFENAMFSMHNYVHKINTQIVVHIPLFVELFILTVFELSFRKQHLDLYVSLLYCPEMNNLCKLYRIINIFMVWHTSLAFSVLPFFLSKSAYFFQYP